MFQTAARLYPLLLECFTNDLARPRQYGAGKKTTTLNQWTEVPSCLRVCRLDGIPVDAKRHLAQRLEVVIKERDQTSEGKRYLGILKDFKRANSRLEQYTTSKGMVFVFILA